MLEQFRDKPEHLLVDCVDPLGRNGLIIAIENENYELIQLLLAEGVKVKVQVRLHLGRNCGRESAIHN
jgi:hypothetical protein